MLLTLKWMDNLRQTECHQRICHLLFIFNLTRCKFVALKVNTLTLLKIIAVNRPSTLLSVFLMRKSGCPANGENWVGWGRGEFFPCKSISLKFPLLLYAHVMLNLIYQYLLNAVFSITKALNGQISPKQHFYYPHLLCYLENSASLNACFPLFHTLFFILNLIKFPLTRSSWDFVALC